MDYLHSTASDTAAQASPKSISGGSVIDDVVRVKDNTYRVRVVNRWHVYEQEKSQARAALECGDIDADEYDRKIREITKRLGI